MKSVSYPNKLGDASSFFRNSGNKLSSRTWSTVGGMSLGGGEERESVTHIHCQRQSHLSDEETSPLSMQRYEQYPLQRFRHPECQIDLGLPRPQQQISRSYTRDRRFDLWTSPSTWPTSCLSSLANMPLPILCSERCVEKRRTYPQPCWSIPISPLVGGKLSRNQDLEQMIDCRRPLGYPRHTLDLQWHVRHRSIWRGGEKRSAKN